MPLFFRLTHGVRRVYLTEKRTVFFMRERKIGIKNQTATIMSAAFLGVFLACTAGCHSSDNAAATSPPVQQPPQSQAEAIQKVQNNPNIPPETKASIINQLQSGQNHTPAAPAASPP